VGLGGVVAGAAGVGAPWGWIAPGLMEAVMTGRITAMGLKEVLVGAARAGD